jgi:hypothetical protein
VAADGPPGTNGVYTGELLVALQTRGFTTFEVFTRAALSVMSKTRNRQRPWISASALPEFYFGAAVGPAPVGYPLRRWPRGRGGLVNPLADGAATGRESPVHKGHAFFLDPKWLS